MTAETEETPISRAALAGIFGGLFCGYVGLTSVIPVLPGFVRDTYDASDLMVGTVVTTTAFTALLIRPVAGQLADRYGHRRVMQAGALVVAACGLSYFLRLGLTGLVVIRLVLGAGEAALFTAGAVWTMSIAPHARRGQLIGLYGVSMWGGISLGTFLGAVLEHFGRGAVWAFSALAGVCAFLLISTVQDRREVQAAGGGGLMLRPALVPGLALGLGAAGYAGLAAFVVLHLEHRGSGSGVVVLSCFSAVYAGTRLVIGHFPDRYGARRVAIWCGLGESLGLLTVAVAPNVAVAVVGSIVMGVGFSLLHPSLAVLVLDRTDPARRGAALGAYTSFWDLGMAVWGPLLGLVAAGFGYPAVFVAGAICAAAASGVAFAVRPQEAVVT
ncbi:MAG: MFS transporter [Streptosporangiaceae bacterium]